MTKIFIIGTEVGKDKRNHPFYKMGKETHSLLLAKIWLKQGKNVFLSFDSTIRGQVLSIDKNLIHTKSVNGGSLIAIPK